MLKYILLLIPIFIYAQTYMAKIEPKDKFTIYSLTSGQIIKLDKKDEMKVVNKTLIKFDDKLEKQKLNIYQNQLSLYKEKLNLLNSNYKKFKSIRGKSDYEKDEKYYEIINLEVTIANLKLSITDIKDTIDKKSIKVKNLYIKEFIVNNNDFVSVGAKLATAYDISGSKLTVYVSSDDYQNIQNKKVLIDGKSDIATISKIDKILDDTFISAYKIELKLKSNRFGKAVKVEFVK